MNTRELNGAQGIPPGEPDENWWAAVLSDEPQNPYTVSQSSGGSFEDSPTEEPAKAAVDWSKIKAIYANDQIICLSVIGFNRGGILVAGEDIRGFVPTSHLIDVPADLPDEDREPYFTSYLDRNISLKIIECEPEKERVVFSERAALAGEGCRRELLTSLQVGDVIEGVVTNVTDFGAFVDLGGLEGLIHVSELSWGRVQDPGDILHVNDTVKTLVLQVAEDKGRIALSLKRLEDNPWEVLAEKLKPGDIVHARITNIVKYGAFARLDEGVEGLIHISSMTFPSGCLHIDEFLYEDQPVSVCILHIDPHKRRLGLKLENLKTE